MEKIMKKVVINFIAIAILSSANMTAFALSQEVPEYLNCALSSVEQSPLIPRLYGSTNGSISAVFFKLNISETEDLVHFTLTKNQSNEKLGYSYTLTPTTNIADAVISISLSRNKFTFDTNYKGLSLPRPSLEQINFSQLFVLLDGRISIASLACQTVNK